MFPKIFRGLILGCTDASLENDPPPSFSDAKKSTKGMLSLEMRYLQIPSRLCHAGLWRARYCGWSADRKWRSCPCAHIAQTGSHRVVQCSRQGRTGALRRSLEPRTYAKGELWSIRCRMHHRRSQQSKRTSCELCGELKETNYFPQTKIQSNSTSFSHSGPVSRIARKFHQVIARTAQMFKKTIRSLRKSHAMIFNFWISMFNNFNYFSVSPYDYEQGRRFTEAGTVLATQHNIEVKHT